jgi:hypothetical protein
LEVFSEAFINLQHQENYMPQLTSVCFFCLLNLQLFSQVYEVKGGKTIELTEQSELLAEAKENPFERLSGIVASIQDAEPICIVDSVLIEVKTSKEGLPAAIRTLFSRSANHALQLEEALSKMLFGPNLEAQLLFKFKPRHNALSVFELEQTPKISACRRTEFNQNLLFDVSCFNYHIIDEVLKQWGKLRFDYPKIEGPVAGKITFDQNGNIVQVDFDDYCFNALLNDLAAKNLESIHFKKGSLKNGLPSGYQVLIPMIVLVSNRSDIPKILEEADHQFVKGNLDSALYNYTLANTLGSAISENQIANLGYAYHSFGLKGRAQDTWRRLYPNLGLNFLISATLDNAIVQLTTTEINLSLMTFKSCQAEDSAKSELCFFDSLTAHIQDNFKINNLSIPAPFQILASFKVNAKGGVVEVVLTKPSPFKNANLQAIKSLCSLPVLVPATLDDKPVELSSVVPINIQSSN